MIGTESMRRKFGLIFLLAGLIIGVVTIYESFEMFNITFPSHYYHEMFGFIIGVPLCFLIAILINVILPKRKQEQ